MCKLDVEIKSKDKTYPIFINNDNIENLKALVLEQINGSNYVLIISKKVYEIYGKILNFPKDKIFILKDGENQKNLKNYVRIMNFVFSKGLKRTDYIISIGGGVVGDLSGFVASTYMRGINLIQIPTTLLACTDSSVGGKTAINTHYGKNLIGSFYQPKAVFININFLKTLDEKQFKSGLGEVLKYAFIEKSCKHQQDLNLMNFLNENYDKILSKDILTLRDMVEICVKLKISVVTQDEKESGLRRILNFGHSYGHAIEKITNYRKYTHGECVVEGINFALNLSYTLGKIDKEYRFLCQDLIKKFGFNSLPKFSQIKISNAMQSDKKNSQDGIFYILPTGFATVEDFKISIEDIFKNNREGR